MEGDAVNNDDILKLCGESCKDSISTREGVIAFATVLREKDQVRIAELEDALEYIRDAYLPSTMCSIIASKALTNKSNWLREHDLEVRKKVVEEAALIVCPIPHVEEERECSDIANQIRCLIPGTEK
jgi:hypothetical protein